MSLEWVMGEDLDTFAAEHSDPMAAFEEDILHRISTRRGSNLDDEDFGESIFDWLSSSEDLDGMKATLETEIGRDDRTSEVTVSLERLGAEAGVRITIDVLADSGELLRIVRVATGGGELVTE